MPKAEGRIFPYETDLTKIRKDLLEAVPFEESKELITITTDEFSAVCPFSGLPDFGELKIEYYPNGKIVELKSLKYYIISFRNIGVYQEQANKIIYEDLKELLGTDRLKVSLTYNIRGGMKVSTTIGGLDNGI